MKEEKFEKPGSSETTAETTASSFLKDILTAPDKTESKLSKVVLIGEDHASSEIRQILLTQAAVLKEHGCTIMLEGVPASLNKIFGDIAKTGTISSSQRQAILDQSTFVQFEDFIFITLATKHNIPVVGCETQQTDPRLHKPVERQSGFFSSSPSSPSISEEKFAEFKRDKRNLAGNLSWGAQLQTLREQTKKPIIFIGGKEHIVGTKAGTKSMQTIVGENTVGVVHQLNFAKKTEIKAKVSFTASADPECKGTYDYSMNTNSVQATREMVKQLADDSKGQTQMVVNQIAFLLLNRKQDGEVSYAQILKQHGAKSDIADLVSLLPASATEKESIKQAINKELNQPSADKTVGLDIDALCNSLHKCIDGVLEERLLTPSC